MGKRQRHAQKLLSAGLSLDEMNPETQRFAQVELSERADAERVEKEHQEQKKEQEDRVSAERLDPALRFAVGAAAVGSVVALAKGHPEIAVGLTGGTVPTYLLNRVAMSGTPQAEQPQHQPVQE